MNDLADPTVVLPKLPGLSNALAELFDLPRPEYVAAIKERRAYDFAVMASMQLERINEITGQDMATQITAHTDGIVRALTQRALHKAQAPDDWENEFAVAALGSYGRCELAPYSDIDLVVVHRSRTPADWVRDANQELNTLLWDVGFQVGSSMRSLAELESIIRDDFVTATAVLEQRCLMGADEIAAQLDEIRERFRTKRTRAFCVTKCKSGLIGAIKLALVCLSWSQILKLTLVV